MKLNYNMTTEENELKQQTLKLLYFKIKIF